MERTLPSSDLPFEVGALYYRRSQIHTVLGGQQQGGISTPADKSFVILFTGEAGRQHGYHDFWDEDGILHYFGEGQTGHMSLSGGNLAISAHLAAGKRLLLFQMMGKGKPCRFLGEFAFLHVYEKQGVPDRNGNERKALVFMLRPIEKSFEPFHKSIGEPPAKPQNLELSDTFAKSLVEVRTKQALFRRRLLFVEKKCRLTGISDLRFLTASHIRPWAKCESGAQRVDGNNGLLLSPAADLLFDRGWISFDNGGGLLRAEDLPKEAIAKLGLNLTPGRKCGEFNGQQTQYLDFHRNAVFNKAFKTARDPVQELFGRLT